MTEATTEQLQLQLRLLRKSDYPAIKSIMDRVYLGDLDGAWAEDQYQAMLNAFPDGQFGIEDNGTIVAAALSHIVNYDDWGDKHRYWEIIGDGYLTTHKNDGDSLYGVDLFVSPDYRGMRLGRRLYDARKELCENLNLERIIFGARLPGYAEHKGQLSAREYLKQVGLRELVDPVVTFQLANGFHLRRLVRGYLPEDEASDGWAAILEWNNINYEAREPELIGAEKNVVRVGALQWQMRSVKSLDDMLNQVEYFIDVLGDYQADFALLPEFFTGPLMGLTKHSNSADAVRALADYTEAMREKLTELAVSYNVNIIGGSMPEYDGGTLHNSAFLCRRDGSWEKQRKIHITPDEKHFWGLTGGDKVMAFDTDAGRIGILICYDVEFPELPRLLAEQGIKILFVPYWTDTKNGYLRVRACAAARAIENECYVVITGSVGNLPNVDNMDIQYSQSAVFSPSDFSFPHDAIVAEATPNTEMSLIVDLNYDLLKQLHEHGSVRNLKDRRTDLFSLSWKK